MGYGNFKIGPKALNIELKTFFLVNYSSLPTLNIFSVMHFKTKIYRMTLLLNSKLNHCAKVTFLLFTKADAIQV